MKTCFIITPIGEKDSDTWKEINSIIDNILRPVLYDIGFLRVDAAHHISQIGSITYQVIDRIINDDLVIANLSGLNPNVMYELALRHATLKPVIQICNKGTKLPFDIYDQRTIFFENAFYEQDYIKNEIKKFVHDSIINPVYIDNPIYKAINFKSLLNKNDAEDVLKKVIDRFDRLEQSLITKDPAKVSSDNKNNAYYIELIASDRKNLLVDVVDVMTGSFDSYSFKHEIISINARTTQEGLAIIRMRVIVMPLSKKKFKLEALEKIYSKSFKNVQGIQFFDFYE